MPQIHYCTYQEQRRKVIFPFDQTDFSVNGKFPTSSRLLEVDNDFKFSKGNCVLTLKNGTLQANRVFICENVAREYAGQQKWKLGNDVYITNVLSNKDEMDGCSETGVWFLSYLCAKGYIDNADDVWTDYVDGILLKQLPGIFSTIPVGSDVLVRFDACREKMTIWWRNQQSIDENNDDDCWWEKDGVNKLEGTFTLNFS